MESRSLKISLINREFLCLKSPLKISYPDHSLQKMIQHAGRLTLSQGMLLDAIERAGGRVEITPVGKEHVKIEVCFVPEEFHDELTRQAFRGWFDDRHGTWRLSWTNSRFDVSFGFAADRPDPPAVQIGHVYFANDTDESWIADGAGGWDPLK